MNIEEFENFNDLFFNFNKKILNNPQKYLIKYFSSKQAFLDYTIFKVNKPDFDLDIGELYYTINKWNTLKKWYLNEEGLIDLKKKIKENKNKSLVYYFKEKKNSTKNLNILCNKENCLISLVLNKYKLTHKKYILSVYYRSSELNRAFALDLVLINKIIKYLEIDVEYISIIIPAPFFNPSKLILQEKLFDLNLREYIKNNDVRLTEILKEELELLDKNEVENIKWKSLRNILLRYNKKPVSLDIKNLILIEEEKHEN